MRSGRSSLSSSLDSAHCPLNTVKKSFTCPFSLNDKPSVGHARILGLDTVAKSCPSNEQCSIIGDESRNVNPPNEVGLEGSERCTGGKSGEGVGDNPDNRSLSHMTMASDPALTLE